MKSQSYMTRALVSRDPRYARILTRLGYGAKAEEPKTEAPDDADELTALRAQYQETMGKKAYHGWDADTLRAKMEAADSADGSADD